MCVYVCVCGGVCVGVCVCVCVGGGGGGGGCMCVYEWWYLIACEANTVAVNKKFTFRIRSTIVLRNAPCYLTARAA